MNRNPKPNCFSRSIIFLHDWARTLDIITKTRSPEGFVQPWLKLKFFRVSDLRCQIVSAYSLYDKKHTKPNGNLPTTLWIHWVSPYLIWLKERRGYSDNHRPMNLMYLINEFAPTNWLTGQRETWLFRVRTNSGTIQNVLSNAIRHYDLLVRRS